MRLCYVCGLEKPLEDFPRDKSIRTGHKYCCKPCHGHLKSRRRRRAKLRALAEAAAYYR